VASLLQQSYPGEVHRKKSVRQTMKIIKIDFETRATVPIKGKESVGLFNYWTHPDTAILMMAYKIDNDPVEIWEPHKRPLPERVREAFADPKVMVEAFNSAFERYGLKYKLGIDIPYSRWLDPQVGCRYLSLPGDLETAGFALDLPDYLAKDARGEALIKLFSEPHKTRKMRGITQTTYFNDWNSHPKEWEEFIAYCKRDVIAEEEVYRRCEILQAAPLPPFERKLWEWDQLVNDRGIPVDVGFVKSALRLAVRAKQEALDKQNVITGLENANSVTQLLPWVKERGYPYNTLNKNFVDAILKDASVQMTPECRMVLTARREAASTSYTKLAAILRQVCKDGRLRNQFIFMGSSRCGRWSGTAVQLHNLPRPETLGKTPENPDGYDFEDEAVLDEARAMVYAEDYDSLKAKYQNVLSVIRSLIRTVFVAPEVPPC
jgi:DNA polymerase bacteriophage-type